ncbi:putative GTP-binding protein YjiA [Pandoraea terrae]|uniref:Putative GTP-binding protein YjiA n=1 Tax=Pandoraea terrae TaxID=1537710 RepID=A0A5E4WEQ1_9BURK|nr:GTP-binding protein [Pandoraea terrae]VVE22901.1 putative GTP-binding protein YjiA [Pandoraea terrae]
MSDTASPGARLPVHILTGFLGSGKTTLLQHLLADEAMHDTVVLINEFGEVAIDHLLVQALTDEIVLLKSGCLCCAVRDDLTQTLIDLAARRRAGDIPPFSRVVVETTGLADPAPILLTLMSEELVTRDYALAGLVATADAEHGQLQLDTHAEALKQAALADVIVITKTDCMPAPSIDTLAERLAALNPSAVQHRSTLSTPPSPRALFGTLRFSLDAKRGSALAWLAAERHAAKHSDDATIGNNDHSAAPDAAQGRYLRHDMRVGSFCVMLDAPVDWPRFEEWLSLLLVSRGKDILRIKGLLDVSGRPGATVIHGIHHVFYPPQCLPDWPSDDRRSRLVFITTGLHAQAIARSLEDFTDVRATILR